MTTDFSEAGHAGLGGDAMSGLLANASAAVLMETRYDVEIWRKSPRTGLLYPDEQFSIHNRVVTAGLNKLLDATFKTGLATPAWYLGLCGASVTDGAMTTGGSSTSLACATSTPFAAADAGRAIVVRGAGAGGADLVTTIATFTDSGHVVLTAGCSTTVTGASVIFDARAADTMASHTPWLESAAYSNANRPTFTPGAVAGGSVDNSGSVAAFSINANNTLIGGLFLVDNNTKSGTTGTLYGMAPFSTVGFRQLNNGDTLNATGTLTAAAQ